MEREQAEASSDIDAVNADELRMRSGWYLNQVVAGHKYSITRGGKESALLLPYTDDFAYIENVMTATDLNQRIIPFLEKVSNGKSFIIQRGRTRVAALLPPPLKNPVELSDEERLKLIATADLSVQEIRLAVEALKILKKIKR